MARTGRPLKFKSVIEMQKQIDAYFESCFIYDDIFDDEGNVIGKDKRQAKPFTITGLALALDTSRETLIEYQGKKDFIDTIARAKLRCQSYAEEFLFFGKNPTGAMFSLKNNYGWKDKTEQDVSLTVDGDLADIARKARARAAKSTE